MKSSRAFEILKSYALVLRRAPVFVIALPQSLLCHDKDVIKRAIKATVSLVEEDNYEISTLEDAYASLAFFVPDEEAAVVARAQDSKTSDTVDQVGSGAIDRITQIRQGICRNREALVEEFRRFVGA